MKGLTIKQPYAQLVLHGKIETRNWKTSYRGDVLICASADMYSYYTGYKANPAFPFYSEIKTILGADKIRFGKAIAVGKLVDVRPMFIKDEKNCFCHFAYNLFSHIFEDVRAIEPFDIKGQLDYFDIEKEIEENIKFL